MTANIILKGGILEAFPLKLGARFASGVVHWKLVSPYTRINFTRPRMEKSEWPVFSDYIIAYIS